jgi:hypothetical protein
MPGLKCGLGDKSSGATWRPDAATVDAAAVEQFHGSIRLEFPSEEKRTCRMKVLIVLKAKNGIGA